jgi:hypothetical protein
VGRRDDRGGRHHQNDQAPGRQLHPLEHAFLTSQVIPPDNALRASNTLMDIWNDVLVIFSVYRSAMGLVVHLKQLLRGRQMSLYGMFRPYYGEYKLD